MKNQLLLSKISFQQSHPSITPLTGFALTSKQLQTNLDNELVVAGFEKTIQKLQAIKNDQNAKLEFLIGDLISLR